MSHKYYANLAHLDEFPLDLNYTGVPLEGWASPVLVIPIVFGTFSFLTAGKPKSLLSIWALFNFCIIHPMDMFVGTLGIGPKYLVDEYAVLDSRYWVVQDTTVTIVSSLEFLVMGPMCYLWYRSLNTKKWDAPFIGAMLSTWHLIGTLFYFFGELYEGCSHLPGHDCQWPPTFDNYLKLKYFWFIFVGLNWIWIILPLIVIVKCYYELDAAINKTASNKTAINKTASNKTAINKTAINKKTKRS